MARKSGIHNNIIESFKDIENEFSELVKPYADFKAEYEKMKEERIHKENKAYVVTYTHMPSLLYICFTSGRYKAKGNATKYFRDMGVDTFGKKEWYVTHTNARARRVPEWDKYYKDERVPIHEILKLGGVLSCSLCGEGSYTYKDYEDKVCFVVEGEGDICEYIKGYVLCYNCYKKLGGEV